jgi:HPt (histidine-containing phosphotransfer) domain-containing protein
MSLPKKLLNSNNINSTLGLKYLNHNEKLYLKILNNFVTRYKGLNVVLLDPIELKTTMHTFKGISASLGMEALTLLAQELHESPNERAMVEFSYLLKETIEEIEEIQ